MIENNREKKIRKKNGNKMCEKANKIQTIQQSTKYKKIASAFKKSCREYADLRISHT